MFDPRPFCNYISIIEIFGVSRRNQSLTFSWNSKNFSDAAISCIIFYGFLWWFFGSILHRIWDAPAAVWLFIVPIFEIWGKLSIVSIIICRIFSWTFSTIQSIILRRLLCSLSETLVRPLLNLHSSFNDCIISLHVTQLPINFNRFEVFSLQKPFYWLHFAIDSILNWVRYLKILL